MGELAQKADEIDSLWQKHRDFCQGTIAVTVGNAYGREWFGIYTTINAADTPECKMMIQDMQSLAAEIDAGMEAAWEKAHRAGVYPGPDARRPAEIPHGAGSLEQIKGGAVSRSRPA